MPGYFVGKDGKQTGPFTDADVLRQIADGTLSPGDLMWTEGMAGWQPISAVLDVASSGTVMPPPLPVGAAAPADAALFLHIPVSRLIAMSIVSFGIYEAYWVYRNWRYIKERDHLKIQPFWRGVFAVLFCHSLLRRMADDKEARAVQPPTFSPGTLATVWVVLMLMANLISRAPGAAVSIVAVFIPSYLCLVPVQNYVNAVHERRTTDRRYYPWSSGHIVCLVLGLLMWLVLLVGAGAEG